MSYIWKMEEREVQWSSSPHSTPISRCRVLRALRVVMGAACATLTFEGGREREIKLGWEREREEFRER